MMHYLTKYQSFTTVGEMDEHVKKHSQQHELTKSEFRVLVAISQHALTTPGAAHLKALTIAQKIGVTTKTVYRAVKKLQELGVIQKLAQTKMNGIKGANIYVICPYVPTKMSERPIAENACGCSDGTPNRGTQSLSFQSFCRNKLIVAAPPNTWHEQLIHLFKAWPIEAAIFEQIEQAIPQLAITNTTDFDRAKRIVQDISVRVQTGTITVHSSLVSLVIGAYEKWILPPTKPDTIQRESKRPVAFYNWLEERA